MTAKTGHGRLSKPGELADEVDLLFEAAAEHLREGDSWLYRTPHTDQPSGSVLQATVFSGDFIAKISTWRNATPRKRAPRNQINRTDEILSIVRGDRSSLYEGRHPIVKSDQIEAFQMIHKYWRGTLNDTLIEIESKLVSYREKISVELDQERRSQTLARLQKSQNRLGESTAYPNPPKVLGVVDTGQNDADSNSSTDKKNVESKDFEGETSTDSSYTSAASQQLDVAILSSISVSQNRLTSVYFTDSNWIVVGGFSGDLLWIDPSMQGVQRLSASERIIRCVLPFTSGQVLIGDDAGRVLLVEDDKVDHIEIARLSGQIFWIEQNPTDSSGSIFTADRQGSITEWSLDRSKPSLERLRVVQRHDGAAFAFFFNSRSNSLTSVGADGYLRETNLSTGTYAETEVCPDALFCIVSSGREMFAGSSTGQIHVIDGESRQVTFLLEAHSDAVRSLDISPGGKWMASCGKDGSLRLWHLPSRRNIIIYNDNDYLYCVKFDREARQLAACSGSGDVLRVRFSMPIDQLENISVAQSGNER